MGIQSKEEFAKRLVNKVRLRLRCSENSGLKFPHRVYFRHRILQFFDQLIDSRVYPSKHTVIEYACFVSNTMFRVKMLGLASGNTVKNGKDREEAISVLNIAEKRYKFNDSDVYLLKKEIECGTEISIIEKANELLHGELSFYITDRAKNEGCKDTQEYLILRPGEGL